MAGAPYKLAIGVSIDPSAAKTGGAQTQQALSGIKQAAAQTESQLQKLIATSTGLYDGPANDSARRWVGALADEALAVDNLRAKYNPLYATIQRYQQAKTEIRTANAMGALSADEMTAALQRERQATLATIDAIKGRNTALANVPKSAANQNFQAANVAYQLQDIVSTAALGASPLTVALQQGPQLASVFGNMGAAGAVSTLAAAFASLASPVSLVTIGLTAAGAAAIQYFSSFGNEASQALETLDKHNEQIIAVASRWGDALPALKRYVEQLQRAKDGQDLSDAVSEVASRQWDKARRDLEGLRVAYAETISQLSDFGGKEELLGKIQSGFSDIENAVRKGIAPTQNLAQAQTLLADGITQTGLPSLEAYRQKFLEIIRVIDDARGRASTFTREQIVARAGGDNVQDIIGNSIVRDGNGTRQAASFTPTIGPRPENRPLIELEGLPGWQKEQKAATGVANAYRDLIKSADDRVAQMRLEAQLAGETGVAADALRFKIDLLQQGEEKGRSLSAAQVEAINQRVEAFKRYADEAARAKLQSDILFDRDQLGRSAMDQQIASALRGSGLPVDFDSYEAGLIRTNLQLQQARNLAGGFVDTLFGGLEQGEGLWESFGDAGLSVLRKLGDSLVNDVLNNIFSINNASSGSGLFGGLLSGLFGDKSSSSAGSAIDWASGGFDFDRGGYTGPGGIHEPRGVVHAGEVVWSQRDVSRAGGVATVEAMRLGRRGYADGGAVDVQPLIPASRRAAFAGGQSDITNVHVTSDVRVSVDQNGNLKAFVTGVASQVSRESVGQGLDQFSRSVLPGRLAEINEDPFAVG